MTFISVEVGQETQETGSSLWIRQSIPMSAKTFPEHVIKASRAFQQEFKRNRSVNETQCDPTCFSITETYSEALEVFKSSEFLRIGRVALMT